MSTVFAGSDASFMTGWQMWKLGNHEHERFVLAGEDTGVSRSTDDGDCAEYVWYVEIGEDELPDGVFKDGVTVRDTRSGVASDR